MTRTNKSGRSIGYSYFLRRRVRRRKRHHRLGRGRRKHHPARHAKLVPSHDANSTNKPKENKILLFYSQNVAGLSAQSREESINLMEKYNVTVTCLQETWTGTTQKDSEFEDRRNGFLFLLKGNEKPTNQRGRNRCGIGFILSPLARKAWTNAGQHPVKQHPTPDGMARIASIKLTFNLDKPSQKNFFICTAYAPDSSYEKSFPYEVFIASLTDAVKECPKDHILVLGADTNCKLGNCNSTPPLETEEGEGKNYPTIGKYNLPQLNERGNMLRQFLSMNELCATNTFLLKIATLRNIAQLMMISTLRISLFLNRLIGN